MRNNCWKRSKIYTDIKKSSLNIRNISFQRFSDHAFIDHYI